MRRVYAFGLRARASRILSRHSGLQTTTCFLLIVMNIGAVTSFPHRGQGEYVRASSITARRHFRPRWS